MSTSADVTPGTTNEALPPRRRRRRRWPFDEVRRRISMRLAARLAMQRRHPQRSHQPHPLQPAGISGEQSLIEESLSLSIPSSHTAGPPRSPMTGAASTGSPLSTGNRRNLSDYERWRSNAIACGFTRCLNVFDRTTPNW